MTDMREPAFPCSNEQFTHGNPQTGDAWPGMSLRDFIAVHAMAAIIAKTTFVEAPEDWVIYEKTANGAFDYADAMLKARV